MGKRTLKFTRPRLERTTVRKILASGIPNFLNNVAGRGTSIVMNMMFVRYGGGNAVSTYGVLMYADGIIQPVLYGTCDALQPSIGYNWGT